MNERSKATIYINSNADNTTGLSPHGQVHPYLQAKISTLDTNGSYERAVVNGKLAYKLQVAAEAVGNPCGAPGRLVRFYANGTLLPLNSVAWDNRQAWFHPLGPPNNPIYLPLVVRGGIDTD